MTPMMMRFMVLAAALAMMSMQMKVRAEPVLAPALAQGAVVMAR